MTQDMTTVLHTGQYDRFTEIQSKLRRKKLHRKITAPIFLKAVLAVEII